jgi:hypothetical protein
MRTSKGEYLKSQTNYISDLVEAGVHGAVSAWKAVDHAPRLRISGAMVSSTVAGGAIGLLTAGICADRPRSGVIRSGLVGAVIGLAVGAAWTSRAVAQSMVRGAAVKINGVRDTHWLERKERNPVAYG